MEQRYATIRQGNCRRCARTIRIAGTPNRAYYFLSGLAKDIDNEARGRLEGGLKALIGREWSRTLQSVTELLERQS